MGIMLLWLRGDGDDVDACVHVYMWLVRGWVGMNGGEKKEGVTNQRLFSLLLGYSVLSTSRSCRLAYSGVCAHRLCQIY